MDPDILELVRLERLTEAAELASRRGQAADASRLFERACEWSRAAAEALRAAEPRRALELALQARDAPLAERAFAAVSGEARAAETLAPYLAARGHTAWAARLYESAGRDGEAGAAWERAGDAVRASQAFERHGDVARAVHVLETAMRRKANSAVFLSLGAILVRLGKDEPGVRALQRVPHDAAERPAALRLLVPALARLGWSGASSEAARELAAFPDRTLTKAGTPNPGSDAGATATPLLFRRYLWIADIASSSSARVFEAESPLSRERLVVKVFAVPHTGPLARAARDRFEHDLNVTRSLDHPHLVPVRDVLVDVPATVLAKMPAGSLEALLARGPIAPVRAVEIAAGVLSALAEAHRRGVLHGDIKPANVLFDAAGSARLCDFGTVHLADLSATTTAGTFGSLGYRSPEEREGCPGSTRSDVFSVGALLYEMLTGLRPTAVPAASAAWLRPSVAHPDLGAAHDRLLARFTAHDPVERPGDALAAQNEIQRLLWPTRLRPTRPEEHPVAARIGTYGPRIEALSDGGAFDAWTGRAIERIPLSDEVLARARGFAAAAHPCLQAVLRIDHDDGTLWLLALPKIEQPVAPGPASVRAQALLREAVVALHAAGIVHGSVESNLVVHGAPLGEEHSSEDHFDKSGAFTLGFGPCAPPNASFADDLAAIDRLGASGKY